MTQQTFRLPASGSRPSLFVRRQPSSGAPAVLYVHGATFPSALSVGFDFGGGSWLDDWKPAASTPGPSTSRASAKAAAMRQWPNRPIAIRRFAARLRQPIRSHRSWP